MSLKEIKIEDLNLNPMSMIGNDWWLITAGNNENGFNTMTASWGHLGSLWERPKRKAHMGLPTACVYIRPHRYTKEYMDREDLFTLSVFDEHHKKALGYLGTHSGRDENKIEKTNLTPLFQDDTTMFQEAKMVFVCQKIYHAPILESGFVDQNLIKNNYPLKDFHEMYVGEIIKVYIQE